MTTYTARYLEEHTTYEGKHHSTWNSVHDENGYTKKFATIDEAIKAGKECAESWKKRFKPNPEFPKEKFEYPKIRVYSGRKVITEKEL